MADNFEPKSQSNKLQPFGAGTTPSRLIAKLAIGPLSRLAFRFLFLFLAAEICDARLENGQRLTDLPDVKAWFMELAAALERAKAA